MKTVMVIMALLFSGCLQASDGQSELCEIGSEIALKATMYGLSGHHLGETYSAAKTYGSYRRIDRMINVPLSEAYEWKEKKPDFAKARFLAGCLLGEYSTYDSGNDVNLKNFNGCAKGSKIARASSEMVKDGSTMGETMYSAMTFKDYTLVEKKMIAYVVKVVYGWEGIDPAFAGERFMLECLTGEYPVLERLKRIKYNIPD